jgi:hypothetical protein
MAATLTAGDNEMTHFSFPIEKSEETETINPVDGTPDIIIWGKASDGTLDSDLQIVDPQWSESAIKTWFDTRANIRMQHDPKKPVGRGLEVDGHYVKALIADPDAKHKVRTKVLNDFSVGICNPDIRVGDPRFSHLDPEHKAVRGVITGRDDGISSIGEISVVDRGSNYGTQFQLVKAAADGTPELTGTMIGGEPDVTKDGEPDVIKASLSFSPADLEKLLAHRKVAEDVQAEKAAAGADEAGGDNASADDKDEPSQADMKPDNETDDDTSKAADAEEAEVAEPDAAKAENPDEVALKAVEVAVYKRDVSAAERKELASRGHALSDGSYPIANAEDLGNAAVLARSGHGNVAAAKALIGRRAKDLGVPNPLSADKAADVQPEAAEDVTDKAVKPKMSCPECGKKSKAGRAFCFKCGKKMTPDKDDDTADKAASPSDSASEAADTQPVPAHREPDGTAMELLEQDAGMTDGDEASGIAMEGHVAPPAAEDAMTGKTAGEEAAQWRIKNAGAPWGEGLLHDLLCPAFSPDVTAKCYPDLTVSAAAAPEEWQSKALSAAIDAPIAEAGKAQRRWQDALTLHATDGETITGLRWDAHKSFTDANPGPATYPTPGELRPQSFRRPALSGSDQANTTAASGASPSTITAAHISAADFQRGPLTGGQEASSEPQGDNGTAPGPSVTGRPQRTFYRNTSRDTARSAMQSMHDHIAQTFPDLCPMCGPGHNAQPAAGARPVPVPGSKKAEDEPEVTKAEDAEVTKAAVKPAKMPCSCGAKARPGKFCGGCGKKMPMKGADKAAGPALPEVTALVPVSDDQAEVIKAAVAAAIAPLAAQLKEQGELIDQMAAAPDPRYAPFKAVAAGGVLPKAMQAAPEVPQQTAVQKAASNVQASLIAELQDQARNNPDPGKREVAWAELTRLLNVAGGR